LPLERRAQSRLVRKAPGDADGNAVYNVDSPSTVGPFRRRSARPREVYESVLRSAAMVASPGRARREARPLRAAQGYARSSSLASRSPHWRRSPTARRRRATAGSRPPAPTKRLRSSGSRLPLRFVPHASRAAELTRCRTFFLVVHGLLERALRIKLSHHARIQRSERHRCQCTRPVSRLDLPQGRQVHGCSGRCRGHSPDADRQLRQFNAVGQFS
jgi:hypothetical protein